MTIARFKIGDRVIVKDYKDIPEESRNKGVARLCGKVGTITNKLQYECGGRTVYMLQFDDYNQPSSKLWGEEYFEPYTEKVAVTYHYEFDFLDNVVVARLYEVNGDNRTEIERGHGHIIHEGAKGIAQASAYALKKIFEKMNGGSLTNV